MWTMESWSSAAAARASRMSRERAISLPMDDGERSLSATLRPSLVSRARQITPMPPSPRGETSS
jgi:hypothetical protein